MNRDRWMPLSSLIFVTMMAVATFFKWGAFIYTLKPGAFVFLGQPHPPLRPRLPMYWYGFVVTSLLVTIIAAVVLRYLPGKPLRVPPVLYWALPVASSLYIIYAQLSWFRM